MSKAPVLARPYLPDTLDASAWIANAQEPWVRAAQDDLDILRIVVEGTASSTGEEFFKDLVRHLALALDVPFAAISEFSTVSSRVRTLAFWADQRIQDNFEYDLSGTPCEEVMRGKLCHFPMGVKDLFPHAKPLNPLEIESYLGTPLLDGAGKVLGLLAVFDTRPMPAQPRHLYLLRIFAARVAAVLERLRAEKLLSASERRFRDLYEEAPVGYLSLGVDGRILSANHQAAQMIGYSLEELEGLPIAELFEAPGISQNSMPLPRFLAGEELAGLEVKMQRKDGQACWISVWMRPIRDGSGQVQASRLVWVDITDRIVAEADRARLVQQNYYLQDEIKATHNFEELIGESPPLRAVLDKVRSVAPTDASVLITGETGTGKELIARAIHSASKRRDKPLIKINCAAFPAGLVESELFGHEKGAFTHAISRRIGRFELAHGGTIFLDEIGEIAPETQVKLLRVLQEREFDRVGGTSPIKVDIRIVAATNRNLLEAVREKTFREDLYYRLNVFPIALPPLRERTDDIPMLARFLVNKFATRLGKRIGGITDQAMQRLIHYPWPGNIRELENVLERAVILARGAILDIDPSLAPPSAPAPMGSQNFTLQSVERDHVVSVLEQTGWVVDGPRGAAQILAIHPNTLRNRMKKLGISRASHQIR